MPESLADRFLHRVRRGPGSCLVWTGRLDHRGYGVFDVERQAVKAHRFWWEQENGPVPEGLELDHLCRRRSCVNPDHLEAVTHRVNTLRGQTVTAINSRKTHCPRGHPYDEENTLVYQGRRYCRTCRKGSHGKPR